MNPSRSVLTKIKILGLQDFHNIKCPYEFKIASTFAYKAFDLYISP